MDTLAKNFMEFGLEEQAAELLKECRINSLWNIGITTGEFLEEFFPFSKKVLEEYSICLYYAGEYEKSHMLNQKILKFLSLNEGDIRHILANDHYNYPHLQSKYSEYNPGLVKKIELNNGPSIHLFTFSITTCKRLDLFTKTMNSFIACCQDHHLISEWLCVDDNSSEEDRRKMKELYPFLTFILKDENNKGHPRSMNIIREKVKSPYLIHLEDDWEFFIPRNYLTDALNVINSSPNINQCLFNQNYAETAKDVSILGGIFKRTFDGLPYYIHDNCGTQEFINKYGNGNNCAYWPHFSFRPSLVKTAIFRELGEYNETANHFEMDYARKYADSGKVSAFFPGIHCIHTGRLTSERFDVSKQNAYTLNDQHQFTRPEKMTLTQKQIAEHLTPEVRENLMKMLGIDQEALQKMIEQGIAVTQSNEDKFQKVEEVQDIELSVDEIKELLSQTHGLIVNMDNREDRLEKVLNQTKDFKYLGLTRFPAINGYKLKPNFHLSRLFDGNDYNMRRGMVGCAMSHIKIMIDFLSVNKNYCLVLEDDIELVKDFEEKLAYTISKLPVNFGLLYLGYHIREQFITPLTFSKESFPLIHPWTDNASLKQSMGGTFGYLISKQGCQEILNFIDERGMTNGIDTMQQKAASAAKVFYCEPMLVLSECYRGDKKIDSDIQYDYSSLSIPFETLLEHEFLDFLTDLFGSAECVNDWETANELADRETLEYPVIYDSRQHGRLAEFIEKISGKFCYYTLDNLAVVFFSEELSGRIYKHRGITRLTWKVQSDSFCGTCGNEYSVEKCLEYEA